MYIYYVYIYIYICNYYICIYTLNLPCVLIHFFGWHPNWLSSYLVLRGCCWKTLKAAWNPDETKCLWRNNFCRCRRWKGCHRARNVVTQSCGILDVISMWELPVGQHVFQTSEGQPNLGKHWIVLVLIQCDGKSNEGLKDKSKKTLGQVWCTWSMLMFVVFGVLQFPGADHCHSATQVFNILRTSFCSLRMGLNKDHGIWVTSISGCYPLVN